MGSTGEHGGRTSGTRRLLGIFARLPVPQQVKTRLANAWNPRAACDLYEAFLYDIRDQYRQTADARVWCYTPDTIEARHYFRELAGNDYELVPQAEGNLGDRLDFCFRSNLESRADQLIVIGADSPTLPQAYIQRAFSELQAGCCDSVLGPALDGGYYLVGLRKWQQGLFDDIDWGGSSVCSQQARRFEESQLSVNFLPPWHDIDTRADLERLKGELARQPAAATCPTTTAVLQRLREL